MRAHAHIVIYLTTQKCPWSNCHHQIFEVVHFYYICPWRLIRMPFNLLVLLFSYFNPRYKVCHLQTSPSLSVKGVGAALHAWSYHRHSQAFILQSSSLLHHTTTWTWVIYAINIIGNLPCPIHHEEIKKVLTFFFLEDIIRYKRKEN